jgi:hypothetical protein
VDDCQPVQVGYRTCGPLYAIIVLLKFCQVDAIDSAASLPLAYGMAASSLVSTLSASVVRVLANTHNTVPTKTYVLAQLEASWPAS